MSEIMTVAQFCEIYYGLAPGENPKPSQLNTVNQMCREGKFKRAFKVGRKWLIDLSKEGMTNDQ